MQQTKVKETTIWVVTFGNGRQVREEVSAYSRKSAKEKLKRMYPNAKGYYCQNMA